MKNKKDFLKMFDQSNRDFISDYAKLLDVSPLDFVQNVLIDFGARLSAREIVNGRVGPVFQFARKGDRLIVGKELFLTLEAYYVDRRTKENEREFVEFEARADATEATIQKAKADRKRLEAAKEAGQVAKNVDAPPDLILEWLQWLREGKVTQAWFRRACQEVTLCTFAEQTDKAAKASKGSFNDECKKAELEARTAATKGRIELLKDDERRAKAAREGKK